MNHLAHSLIYRDKILDLQQAIFHVYTESGDKIPVSLIQSIKMDEEGDIWFTIARLPLYTANSFYTGELCLYKKGLSYYMNIYGTAAINNLDPLLLRFTVLSIEYKAYNRPESLTRYLKKNPIVKFFSHVGYLRHARVS